MVDFDLSILDGFFHRVEAKSHWQEGPASFDDLQQADRNNVLRPRVFALIDLGGMIEEGRTSKDLFSRFRVDVIVQGQQEPAINGRLWNERP